MAMSSVFFYLPHAKGCGGVCVVGGGSSYDFMGDPAVNMDMFSPDEFIRDNLGNLQTTLSVKSLSQEPLSNTNSSLNQTNKGNVSQNSTAVLRGINSTGNMTSDNMESDNKIIKLGASGAGQETINSGFCSFQ